MIGIVIVSHADLALQFVVAIEHVVGKQKSLNTCAFIPRMIWKKKEKKL